MRYDYNGDLRFSRPLTEEEMDEVIGIICFAYNHVCPNRNNDCLSIDAPEYGSHGYELGQVSEWCKQHNVTLTQDSCIRYTGSHAGPDNCGPDGRAGSSFICRSGGYFV